MNDRTRTTILAVLGGLIAGLVLVVLVIVLTTDKGEPVAVTTTGGPTTTVVTTTIAGTTPPPTTVPATTSQPTTTTTAAPSTTTTVPLPPFSGDTTTRSNPTISGSPGALVDVRIGEHPGFTRVVFEFDGSGEPWYTVGYTAGISGGGSGEPCLVAGSALIAVEVQPGSAFWVEQTYFGPLEINPSFGSVVEVKYCEVFEAALQYGIGVEGMKGFDVFTLQSPQRLVIDIED